MKSTSQENLLIPQASSGTSQNDSPANIERHESVNSFSPQRRSFCLIVLFNLVFTFVAWIVSVQFKKTESLPLAFEDEVINFGFNSSLFDLTMISTAKFLALEVTYGILKLQSIWIISTITGIMTIFIFLKVIFYDFHASNSVTFDWIYILLSLLIAWIEILYLLYFVLSKEKNNAGNSSSSSISRRLTQSFNNKNFNSSLQSGHHDEQYYSPSNSSEELGNENLLHRSHQHARHTGGPTHLTSSIRFISNTQQREEFIKKAMESKVRLTEILSTDDGWRLELDDQLETTGHSRYFNSLSNSRVFKIQTVIKGEAKQFYLDLVERIETNTEWMKLTKKNRILERVTPNIDVVQTLTNEMLGGTISGRSFVQVRTWEQKSPTTFIYCTAQADHSNQFNDSARYTKAINHITAGVITKIDGGRPGIVLSPHSHIVPKFWLTWIICVDLKGYIPKSLYESQIPMANVANFREWERIQAAPTRAASSTPTETVATAATHEQPSFISTIPINSNNLSSSNTRRHISIEDDMQSTVGKQQNSPGSFELHLQYEGDGQMRGPDNCPPHQHEQQQSLSNGSAANLSLKNNNDFVLEFPADSLSINQGHGRDSIKSLPDTILLNKSSASTSASGADEDYQSANEDAAY